MFCKLFYNLLTNTGVTFKFTLHKVQEWNKRAQPPHKNSKIMIFIRFLVLLIFWGNKFQKLMNIGLGLFRNQENILIKLKPKKNLLTLLLALTSSSFSLLRILSISSTVSSGLLSWLAFSALFLFLVLDKEEGGTMILVTIGPKVVCTVPK